MRLVSEGAEILKIGMEFISSIRMEKGKIIEKIR
jgi:hypothetical protein